MKQKLFELLLNGLLPSFERNFRNPQWTTNQCDQMLE